MILCVEIWVKTILLLIVIIFMTIVAEVSWLKDSVECDTIGKRRGQPVPACP